MSSCPAATAMILLLMILCSAKAWVSLLIPSRHSLGEIWLFSLSTSRSAGAWVRSIAAYLHDLHFRWTGAVPARPGLLPAQCARVRSALPAAGTGGACDPCTRHRGAHANRWDRGIERRTCRGIDRRYGPLGRSGWKGQCFPAPSPGRQITDVPDPDGNAHLRPADRSDPHGHDPR